MEEHAGYGKGHRRIHLMQTCSPHPSRSRDLSSFRQLSTSPSVDLFNRRRAASESDTCAPHGRSQSAAALRQDASGLWSVKLRVLHSSPPPSVAEKVVSPRDATTNTPSLPASAHTSTRKSSEQHRSETLPRLRQLRLPARTIASPAMRMRAPRRSYAPLWYLLVGTIGHVAIPALHRSTRPLALHLVDPENHVPSG